MMKILAAVLLAFSTVCGAQVVGPTAPALLNYKGTSLPATCTIGRLFFKTDATAGANIYLCTAANTWTLTAANTATTATNLSGGTVAATTGSFSGLVSITGANTYNNHIVMGSSVTNNAAKYGGITGVQYGNTADPEGIALINYESVDASNNKVFIGGYDGAQNAATLVSIYAAANTTTHVGTLAASFTVNTVSLPVVPAGAGNELLCFNTAGGAVTYASTVLGCVPSAFDLKNPISALDQKVALASVLTLQPGSYVYKDVKTFSAKEYVGLYADDVCAMDERLCGRGKKDEVANYDKIGLTAYLVAALKEQQSQINDLKKQLEAVLAAGRNQTYAKLVAVE